MVIETLIADIEKVLEEGVVDDDNFRNSVAHFSKSVARLLERRFLENRNHHGKDGGADGRAREGDQKPVKTGLRMSNIGSPCSRQVYYKVNNKDEEEKLRPEALLKFLYGDLIEELLLFLAEISGHRVEGRQDELSISGVKGHRDAVIDGVIVDVKSAATFSFKKFKDHTLYKDDPFGYVTQLQSYLHSSKDDPIVTDKTRAAFFVADKQHGHLCLDFHEYREFPWEDWFEYKKAIVDGDAPPPRGFEDVDDGKSGNKKLGTNCSYCGFKMKCWPGVKTYVYSKGPVYLTKVVREPKVKEHNEEEE